MFAFVGVLRTAAAVMAWIAGGALILIAWFVATEVIVRHLFGISFNLGSELSTYALAIAASWGFGFALLARGHVRVDALLRLLPHRVIPLLDLLTLAALSLLAGLLLWYGYGTLAESWRLNARSNSELGLFLWIPQFFWVLGLAAFALIAVSMFAASCVALFKGRPEQITALIGTQTVDEEIAEVLTDRHGSADRAP